MDPSYLTPLKCGTWVQSVLMFNTVKRHTQNRDTRNRDNRNRDVQNHGAQNRDTPNRDAQNRSPHCRITTKHAWWKNPERFNLKQNWLFGWRDTKSNYMESKHQFVTNRSTAMITIEFPQSAHLAEMGTERD